MPGKLMIVDDDALVRSALRIIFDAEPYEVQVCDSGMRAVQQVEKFQPHVVLLDLRLGDMDGVEVLHQIKQKCEHSQVIMLTAYGSIENTVEAMRGGAFDYLQKPFDNHRLKELVRKGMQHWHGHDETGVVEHLICTEEKLGLKIIGKSPQMKKVYESIRRVAQNGDATVLIEGESGTGKELAASLLHYSSPRCDKPFVSLNCGCIPEHLAEAELFGYEKGSFTGALKEGKPGKFELAEGGTLFLDEIGDLSLTAQTKFLRVLEGKTFYRIGGTREIRCNVRIVSATNKSLLEEVGAGNFREDLYYRLSALRIVIPPLRDRAEDILPLATFFLEECCRKNAKPSIGISREAEEILMHHSWRGNVRELKNVMERIVFLENPTVIRSAHLRNLADDMPKEALALKGNTKAGTHCSKLTYDETMEGLLRTALRTTKGNQVRAAKLLGISRSKLRYQMAKYNLNMN